MTIHVVGNCTIDLILTVERFPAPGETSDRHWDTPRDRGQGGEPGGCGAAVWG